MGILDELFEKDFVLNEAPGDEDTGDTVDASPNANDDNAGGGEDTGNDDANTGDENTDNNDQDNADDNNDDQQNNDQDNQGDQENDDNFDIDTDGGDNDDNDEGGEDTGGGDTATDTTDDEPSEEAKSVKDEYDKIYKDLTPEERANRDMILKQNFKELHRICGDLIQETGYFPNTTASQPITRRLISSLHNFRKYIAFYLTNIYSTKSHIENRMELEKYQQIFNGIKSIYNQLEKMLAHNDETDKGN